MRGEKQRQANEQLSGGRLPGMGGSSWRGTGSKGLPVRFLRRGRLEHVPVLLRGIPLRREVSKPEKAGVTNRRMVWASRGLAWAALLVCSWAGRGTASSPGRPHCPPSRTALQGRREQPQEPSWPVLA